MKWMLLISLIGLFVFIPFYVYILSRCVRLGQIHVSKRILNETLKEVMQNGKKTEKEQKKVE